MDTAPRKHSLLVLGGAMFVLQVTASCGYPLAKYGLGIIEPFTFAFYRYIVASAVLLTAVWFTRRQPPIEKSDRKRIVLLAFLIIPFNQTLFLVGQSLTGAGQGALLFATTPVFIYVLAVWHLKEQNTWLKSTGIAVATIGVLVIMLSGALEIDPDYLVGDAILVVSVVAWGYYTILGKPLAEKYGALRMTAYAISIGTLMYLPFGVVFALRYDYSQATPLAWGAILYMALGLSVVVYVLWYWLLKQLDASRIAVYHNVQPIIASAGAYLFLEEALTTAFVTGGIVVIAGVILTELPALRRKLAAANRAG